MLNGELLAYGFRRKLQEPLIIRARHRDINAVIPGNEPVVPDSAEESAFGEKEGNLMLAADTIYLT